MTSSLCSSLQLRMSRARNSEEGTSLSRMTPGTSVMRMSFSACRAAAISPAAVSALMLSAWPPSPLATVATTGMESESTSVFSSEGFTPVTSPTKPMSFSIIWRAMMVLPSFPQRPTARPPASLIRETMLLFTRPTRTISTRSIVGPSVTRSPFLKLGSMPTFSSQELISGPPPCTRTGRMPTQASSTMSATTPALRLGSFIAAPPYLMTTVLPRNFCRYGSASDRTSTRVWPLYLETGFVFSGAAVASTAPRVRLESAASRGRATSSGVPARARVEAPARDRLPLRSGEARDAADEAAIAGVNVSGGGRGGDKGGARKVRFGAAFRRGLACSQYL
mmetsp:Transcript_4522/g.11239  ORF Transcript_4522/g.11239 Transcript_4522/m.11239 type:complete len:336 (-) Transcript_4522:56-1063(-)